MTAQTSTLSLAVDTTQVKTAADVLDKFAQAGRAAEKSATELEKASARNARAQLALEAASRKAQTAQAALNKAMESGPVQQERIAQATAKAQAAQSALQLATLNAAGAHKTASIAAQNHADSLAKAGKQSALTAAQAQQLSYQMNDFFVQVSSGGNPLTALIQQGSQLSGTFGGIGGAVRAVGTALLSTAGAVAGVAAAIGALAYAAYKANDEAQQLRRTLALTGNVAGLTSGGFERLAQSVSNSSGVTIGASKEIVNSLVSTGRFGKEALDATAEAAALFGKATGQSAQDVIKSFEGIKNGAASWAESANRQYHFLSPTMLEHIRSLERQGKQQEAIAATMKAFGDNARTAARDVGTLDKAMEFLSRNASKAIDAVKGALSPRTVDDELQAEYRKYNDLRDEVGTTFLGFETSGSVRAKAALPAQEAIIARLKESIALRDDVAKKKAEHVKLDDSENARLEITNANLSRKAKLTREIESINAKFDAAKERGDPEANERNRQEELTNANARFAGPSSLSIDIEKIRASLDTLTSINAAAEVTLQAQRNAGLIDERAYYAEKARLIKDQAKNEADALRRESARLSQEGLRATTAEGRNQEQVEKSARIALNRARITDIERQAVTQLTVQNYEQANSMRAIAQQYEYAEAAARDYLRQLTLQGQREADSVGLSDSERIQSNARNQIADRFDAARAALDADQERITSVRALTYVEAEEYMARIAQLDAYQDSAQARWQEGFDAIKAAEKDWSKGAARAFKNYSDNAENAAANAERFVGGSINKLEDAFVDFVKTGKLSFKDLFTFMADEFLRNQIRMQIANLGKDGGGIGGIFKGLVGLFTGVKTEGAAAGSAGNAGYGDYTQIGAAKLATGTNYVPYDGMPAILHKGEAVVPAKYNPSAGGAGAGQSVSIGAGQVINVGAGVNRADMYAAISQANAQSEARLKRTMKQGTF